MRARLSLLGVLGLVLAGPAARAATIQETTLFGQRYTVHRQSRAGTFSNGVTISLQSRGKQKANLAFVQGAAPSADRLFVVAPIDTNENADAVADQFYMLEGADADGIFSPTVSKATSFFGGKVDQLRGGRPHTVTWISDANTGLKKDRNLVLTTLSGDDALRFYDLDTLNGDYVSDSLLAIPTPSQPANHSPDPGMPHNGLMPSAVTPNGMLVVAGQAKGEFGPPMEVGVMDPAVGQFVTPKIDMLEMMRGATLRIEPSSAWPTALVRVAANEYWMLASTPFPVANSDFALTQQIYRLRLTIPADLTRWRQSFVRVDVLGVTDLLGLGLHASRGGVFGMTAGREHPNGQRRLYFADWAGNLITLTPVQ